MAKKRAARTKKKRRRGRGGTSTLPGSRPTPQPSPFAGPDALEGVLSVPVAAADPWMDQQREIDRLQGQVDAALTLHQSGKVGDAEVAYKKILASDPFHFDALRLLAAARLGQGDPAGALELFEKASDVGPLDSGMRSNMAFALKEVGRMQESIEVCTEVLAGDPTFTDARFNLGAAYLAADRYAEAKEAFGRVVQERPNNADAWYNQGRALTGEGLHDDAVGSYQRAVDLDPTKINSLLRLGMAHQNAEDQWAAARAYERVLAMSPEDHTAYYLLGRAQQDQGYKHEAIDAYRKAVALNPGYVEALSNLGAALRASGERAEAREAYLQAVEAASDHVPAHFNLANLDLVYGDHPAAESGYRRVLELLPDHFGAGVNLARTIREQGRPDEAAEVARTALENLGAPDPEIAWHQLAAALLDAGDLDGALDAWDSALEANAHDQFALAASLATPVVLESEDDRAEVAKTLSSAIGEQRRLGIQLTPVAKAFTGSPADLSGHGRDDREVLSELESLLRSIDEELQLVAAHCHQPRSASDAPLRIGIVSSTLSDPDDGLLALGLAKSIPRDRASVHVFAIGEPSGELGRSVMEAGDEAEVLPREFIMARNRLCEAALDVAIYVGATRSTDSYFLAFVRAARVQISLGSDGGAGLSSFTDLGLSANPLCMSQPAEVDDPAPGARRFVCSRPLREIGPEFDALAAGILTADPEATLIIRGHGAKYADDALLERMAGADVPTERVVLQRATDVSSLSTLFAGGAVVLEPPGHGWLPTSALAVASGTPTLALQSNRAVVAGVEVVEDVERYICRALELAQPDAGSDPSAGAGWDDDSAVLELVSALESAVRKAS